MQKKRQYQSDRKIKLLMEKIAAVSVLAKSNEVMNRQPNVNFQAKLDDLNRRLWEYQYANYPELFVNQNEGYHSPTIN